MAVILFVGSLLGGATGFWVTLVALITFAIFGGGTAKARESANHDWYSTFRCKRCGTYFLVDDDAVGHDVNS